MKMNHSSLPLLEPVSTRSPPVTLSAEDLTYCVGKRTILSNVTCSFPPGRLSALMGASGAGKTTLLSLLSSAIPPSKITSGKITANGTALPGGFKAVAAVVPQDDILLPTLTPLETLHYTARLRLKAGMEERDRRIEEVLRDLSLWEHRHTVVGSPEQRGLSGGQRKRVSIAVELLIDPSVLFVDEPTSGLDSKMAADVVGILKRVAGQGRAVVCTIHQPSYELFGRFDDLVLLAGGRVTYAGAVEGADQYFEKIGYGAGERENPVDRWIRAMQEGAGEAMANAWEKRGTDPNQVLTEAVNESTWLPGDREALEKRSYPVSKVAQFWVLLQRFVRDYTKDRSKFIGGAALKLTVGVMVGVVWLDQAKPDDDGFYTQDSVFPVQGALFVCCFSSVMDTLFPTVMTLPATKLLLLREYNNGAYSLMPYFIAQLISLLFFQTINALFMGIPIYFLVGLNAEPGRILIFLANLSIMSSIGAALGLFIGSQVKDTQQAQQVVMPTLVPLELFSGYLIPYNKIPDYFLWLYHISFFSYALNMLQLNQFHGMKFSDCVRSEVCPVACFETGEELLEQLHIDLDSQPKNFMALGITFLVLSILAYYGLKILISRRG